jgi:hypothetical protein
MRSLAASDRLSASRCPSVFWGSVTFGAIGQMVFLVPHADRSGENLQLSPGCLVRDVAGAVPGLLSGPEGDVFLAG